MTELRQQGTFSTRWDFIEAPSQIMENWVWEKEVLGRMAVHHGTGEGLPAEVEAKLLASRRFRVATAAMRQLLFATADLAFHRGYEGTDADALLAFYRAVAQPFMPVALYPEDTLPASFGHLFAGDEYAAAYYSYKWAEAIEADLFSVFKQGKLLDREVGMRYRQLVLARGAEREPAELVRAFLGRDSTLQAMLERDGVAATAPSPAGPSSSP
jgi:oligopeptidase A